MKHYTSPRIQRAQLFLMKVSSYLEIACALILIVAICIAFIPVPQNLYSLYLDNGFDLSDFMKKSFDLVIGVELLKMFCRHDIDSIVEVLLFSVARQMVIEHLAIKEALIGCIAVAILFAVRRFLLCRSLTIRTKRNENWKRISTLENGSLRPSPLTKKKMPQ